MNSDLISFLEPLALTVSGNDLFVTSFEGGMVGEFTTSGQTINGDIVSGLADAFGIAVVGNDIYITSRGPSLVAEYTTSGALVNGDLLNASGATGIAYYGGNLYVSYDSAIGEYNATTGAPINAALVSGSGFTGVVVTPEPSTWTMLAIGGAGAAGLRTPQTAETSLSRSIAGRLAPLRDSAVLGRALANHAERNPPGKRQRGEAEQDQPVAWGNSFHPTDRL